MAKSTSRPFGDFERRREERRTGDDRRTTIRFEPDKDDRRGRRDRRDTGYGIDVWRDERKR
jgi:hypothetical protein